MNNEIMLNKMFVGDYLNDNLGHEVINLYQCDNGKFYIYTLAYGIPPKKANPGVIVFMKKTNGGKYEIVAKATGLTPLFPDGLKRPRDFNGKNGEKEREKFQDINKKQREKIQEDDIKYGGVELDKIFDGNSYIKNKYAGYNDIDLYLTFEVKEIVKPTKKIEIELPNWKSSMTMYLSPENYKDKYDEMKEYIEDTANWGKPVEKVNIKNIAEKNTNFLEIIRREDDELIFSNLLKYLLNAIPEKMPEFAKEIFEVENFEEKYFIKREYKNIDIVIEDENNIIVIENKIKSDINGKNKNNQESQLDKYEDIISREKGSKSVKYFILAPNYKNFKDEKIWEIIKYDKIYKFFEKHKNSYSKVKYFDDILSAIKKHTKDTDNIHEDEMFRRLKAVIKKVKENN